MTSYCGHYLPVAARREVLRIYRDRLTYGELTMGPNLSPLDAMRATERYFSGWLAHAVAHGPIGKDDVKSLTDQYRAANYYLSRVIDRPAALRDRRRRDPRTARRA
jgi:hypothetical protein